MPEPDNEKQPYDSYDNDATPTDEYHGPPPNPGRRSQHKALPELRIEIVAVDGEEGERLHALQSAAVYDALLWLAEHFVEKTSTEETDT